MAEKLTTTDIRGKRIRAGDAVATSTGANSGRSNLRVGIVEKIHPGPNGIHIVWVTYFMEDWAGTLRTNTVRKPNSQVVLLEAKTEDVS